LTPSAFTPSAFTPSGLTPVGLTPSGLTPSGLTPPKPPLFTPTPPPLVTPHPDRAATPAGGTPAPLGDTGGRDLSTTMSRTVAELPPMIPQPHRSGLSTPVLLAGAFVITIVLGLGGFYLLAHHRTPPAPVEEAPPHPTTITLSIDSDPTGAEVYSDGI
jgi:hypothetical protein